MLATLLGASLSLASEDPKKLRPGVFLYAAPGMGDPNFAETVVLLVAYDKTGAMGFVVNRPTRVPLRELLKSTPEAEKSELRFHWGGPVQPEAVHALVRSNRPSQSSRRVLGDVYVTGDMADVREALGRPDAPTKVKLLTGYGAGAGASSRSRCAPARGYSSRRTRARCSRRTAWTSGSASTKSWSGWWPEVGLRPERTQEAGSYGEGAPPREVDVADRAPPRLRLRIGGT